MGRIEKHISPPNVTVGGEEPGCCRHSDTKSSCRRQGGPGFAFSFAFSCRDSSSLTGPLGFAATCLSIKQLIWETTLRAGRDSLSAHQCQPWAVPGWNSRVFKGFLHAGSSRTVPDIAARCAVTGREGKQRQGEEFVGIHPPPGMEQGMCRWAQPVLGCGTSLEWSSPPLRTGTGHP